MSKHLTRQGLELFSALPYGAQEGLLRSNRPDNDMVRPRDNLWPRLLDELSHGHAHFTASFGTHVVVKLGAEDRDFLANHTLGWDAFRDRIMQFPPERVAQIAGVPRAQIEALGERLAATRPTAIRMSMGLQRHAGGGMAVRTISCIPGPSVTTTRIHCHAE